MKRISLPDSHECLRICKWTDISIQDYEIHDPDLTELGRNQSKELREKLIQTLPGQLDVGLILVSPMRRTCQTALIALDWLIEQGVPIQAHAGWQGEIFYRPIHFLLLYSIHNTRISSLVRVDIIIYSLNTTHHRQRAAADMHTLLENSSKPCDTGSDLESLKKEFPAIDFSHVDPVYPDKTSPAGAHYAYTRKALLNRAQTCVRELDGRPEKAVVVISHSGFLRQAMTGCFWFNADYRVFDIKKNGDTKDNFVLEQWEQTAKSGGGMGWSWPDMVEIGDGLPVPDEVLPQ